jgi:hypothetical protein
MNSALSRRRRGGSDQGTTTMSKLASFPPNYKADDWIAIGVAARNVVSACARATIARK